MNENIHKTMRKRVESMGECFGNMSKETHSAWKLWINWGVWLVRKISELEYFLMWVTKVFFMDVEIDFKAVMTI